MTKTQFMLIGSKQRLCTLIVPPRPSILSNHYVHTGYHEMRTHRRDSVHVLAVTRAVVLEIRSRRRFIFKMSSNRGKGKNNSFSIIYFFPIKGMKVQQEN